MKRCEHEGPVRVVRGGLFGSAAGEIAVVCTGCGAFQRPYPYLIGSHDRPVPWCGTGPVAFPDGASYTLLSEPLSDWRAAHLAAFEVEKQAAEERRDVGWFLQRALLPPWLEMKTDASTGNLLVRPRRDP